MRVSWGASFNGGWIPGGGARATAGAARAGRQIPGRTRHARRRKVASGQLAQGNEGVPGRALCRRACVHRRWRCPSGSLPPEASTCRERMPGWWANIARNGERKYYLCNLPADTPIKALAGAIKARWICEQAHQQLKEELGLDHFEDRSWAGLHRHAFDDGYDLCLPAKPLDRSGEPEKRVHGPPPQPSLPAVLQALLGHLSRSPQERYPHCGCNITRPPPTLLPK